MGIIRAAVKSISSGLADQWLEVIEPADMGAQTLMTPGVLMNKKSQNRKGSRNVISDGSVIHVYDNQFMILTDGGKIKPSSLVVHAGEIVGLAGLVGAGRSELAQLIFGVRKATAGVIEIDGEPVVIHSPREAIDLGIGFLTENRKEQGLFLELAAQENITMATLERDATWGMLNRRKAQTISDDAIQLLNIRVPHAQVRAGGLSGGNQQKLLISRWVAIGPRILILDEPTRGVDVGAKSEIYRIMNDMARQGVAILMISSELPEVVGMSDRVYVMREGVIAGELQAGDISQESIMTLATGVTDSHLKAGQL